MFELMKIVGMSAVLSAGLVTASEMQQPQAAPAAGKIYDDRVPEGEPIRFARAAFTSGPRDEGGRAPQGSPMLREGKSDAIAEARRNECAAQAWPHVAPDCLGAPDASVRSVRMITIEQRQGTNTSLLVRIPATGPSRH